MENTIENNDQENKAVDPASEVPLSSEVEILAESEIPEVQIEEKIEDIEVIETEKIVFQSEKISDQLIKSHEDPHAEIKTITAENINVKDQEDKQEVKNENKVGVDISMFISPRLLIVIYDKLWPNIIVFIAKNFLKLEVNKSINLDEGEIELLEPIVAEMIKGINMKLNPLTAFLLCSNFFYITKLMEPSNKVQSQTLVKTAKKKRGRPRKVTISNGL